MDAISCLIKINDYSMKVKPNGEEQLTNLESYNQDYTNHGQYGEKIQRCTHILRKNSLKLNSIYYKLI